MIWGGIDAQLCLILELKFGDDPIEYRWNYITLRLFYIPLGCGQYGRRQEDGSGCVA